MRAGRHRQTDAPFSKSPNWPACKEPFNRGGSLSTWFDPGMTRKLAQTGKRAAA
jgi:hypothetical protein